MLGLHVEGQAGRRGGGGGGFRVWGRLKGAPKRARILLWGRGLDFFFHKNILIFFLVGGVGGGAGGGGGGGGGIPLLEMLKGTPKRCQNLVW